MKGGGGILSRTVADDFFFSMITAAQKHLKSSAASNSRLNYITVRRRATAQSNVSVNQGRTTKYYSQKGVCF